MPGSLNYWNTPRLTTVGLGNSGVGTNNVSQDNSNAKALINSETSGNFGTRINSITVTSALTQAGADALLLWTYLATPYAAGNGSNFWTIPFFTQVMILFDDGRYPIVGGFSVVHLPKLILPPSTSLGASHINNSMNLWVTTSGGDGG